MKITEVRSHKESIELARPYTIATRTITAVELLFVRITTDQGVSGVGSASPAEEVTEETVPNCQAALAEDSLGWLVGRDPRHLGAHCRILKDKLHATPAARAAVDMALYDLFAQIVGVPVVDLLGRCHEAIPTSVTLGIMSTDEALAETDEYLGRGFRCLKVKIGLSLEEDVERLRKLREKVGSEILIRVDANQGYTVEEARCFAPLAEELDLELVEQPLPASAVAEMRALPSGLRRIVAADESLHHEADALALAEEPAACGIYNIKLMKCGGISSALAIAGIAEAAGLELMWGCMDESVVSIGAALHAAYACPTTRYLDLDGSFDLPWDPATGGFELENGCLRIPDRPGLGVQFRNETG
ncbi:MAG: dipeptide epimerase [bacterium]|nr:dipeptide epimerase [bacterium]